MKQLKPCPHCGGPAQLYEWNPMTNCMVLCQNNCNGFAIARDEAVKRWNRRSDGKAERRFRRQFRKWFLRGAMLDTRLMTTAGTLQTVLNKFDELENKLLKK